MSPETSEPTEQPDKSSLDSVLSEYAAHRHTIDTLAPELQRLMDAPASQATNDQMVTMAASIQESREVLSGLEAENWPTVSATLAERRLSLTQTLDWQRLIDDFAEGENVDEQSVKTTLYLLSRVADDSFDNASFRLKELGRLHEDLAHYHTAEKPTSPERDVVHGDLFTAVYSWLTTTYQAMGLVSPDRAKKLATALPSSQLEKLASLAHFAGLNGNQEGVTDGTIALALERAVAQRVITFESFDLTDLEDSREHNRRLSVTGEQFLEATTGVSDVTEWVDDMVNQWPAWFTRGLNTVVIMEDMIPSGHVDNEPPQEMHTTQEETIRGNFGAWSQAERTLYIGGLKTVYNLALKTDLDQGTEEQEARIKAHRYVRSLVEYTVRHEVTHNAHFNNIPVRWLRQWCDTTNQDETAITDYVRRVRQGPSQQRVRWEDLCDSAAEFKDEPFGLAAKSIGRFEELNALLEAYSPEVVGIIHSALNEAHEEPITKQQIMRFDVRIAQLFSPSRLPAVFAQP